MLSNEPKRKVTIIEDSHLRGSVLSIKDHLSNNFEIFGFIKPGAGIGQILHSLEVEYTNLTKEDVIVFNGGSYDVGLNKLNLALVQILKFTQVNNNTNIIVLRIPLRYDCFEYCQVNKEILAFNYKLRKIANLYEHITITECSYNREFYTRQGYHLNNKGKRLIFEQTVSKIYKLTKKQVVIPICLKWVNTLNENIILSPQEIICEEPIRNITVDSLMGMDTEPTQNKDVRRISSRPKKPPVTRNTDFLW
jgi:hypothetical protein